MNNSDWKRFYADEYARWAPGQLSAWQQLPPVPISQSSFHLFPHTRLSRSFREIVPVALGLILAGADEVVALGPLHGGPATARPEVTAARAGDPAAIAALRGVYPASAPMAADEFCLDNFDRLLTDLSAALGRKRPVLHRFHPFMVGPHPGDLPGLEALRQKLAPGVPIVATADPIHHGPGYHTPPAELREANALATPAYAAREIMRSLTLLSEGQNQAFIDHARAVRSDFIDTGPVLGHLVGRPWRPEILSMELVDYDDVLASPPPTWVAAPLLRVEFT